MLTCPNTCHRTLSALLAGIAITIAPPSGAAYYVEDDAPPVVASTASLLAPPSHTRGTALTTFAVPFYRGREVLGKLGRESLMFILPTVSAAPQIIIQGRPDPINPKNVDLAHRRALTVKRFLREKGVMNPIQIEVISEPESADIENVYNVTIVLPPATPPAPPTRTAYYPPVDPAAAPSNIPAESVRRLLKIASTQNLTAAETAQLIASLLPGATSTEATADGVTAALRAEGAQARTAVGDGSLPIALSRRAQPPMPTRREWWLDAARTLRDNIEEWARIAGWKPVNWAASNFYEVENTVPVEGDFPDVLRQVADATGLNICAFKRTRTIKVTEGNVSCRDDKHEAKRDGN